MNRGKETSYFIIVGRYYAKFRGEKEKKRPWEVFTRSGQLGCEGEFSWGGRKMKFPEKAQRKGDLKVLFSWQH